jgi:hypothetical protein
MAKMTRNKFVEKYPASPGFSAAVSSRLSQTAQFDLRRKRLPTPHGLFREWLKITLAGDWAMHSSPGVIMVLVSDAKDEKRILDRFKAIGPEKRTEICDRVRQIGYGDSHYAALAAEVGYTLEQRRRP